jgi:acyl-CoA thioester hydrolase
MQGGGPMTRAGPPERPAFARLTPLSLRWNDTDVFGHVNNAEYYGFFDTAAVSFLLESGVIGITSGEIGMVVAESGCRYHSEVIFTDRVEIGMAVRTIGRSSVRYGFGLFVNGAATAAADGFFVHVFVDRVSKRPTAMPDALRAHLSKLLIEEPQS